MISKTRYGLAMLLLLAASLGLEGVSVARWRVHRRSRRTKRRKPRLPTTPRPIRTTHDVEDLEPDWSQLNVDTATLLLGPASKPPSKARQPRASDGSDTSWKSTSKANGTADVSVKQSLSPFWDTRIGADMTVVGPPQTLTSADLLRQKISGDGQPAQSSGTAWAAITAPGVGSIWDKTAIEARVDPAQEQGKLGTSLSKSLPLGEQYSLTLQNGYNVIQQGIVPVPGIAAHPSAQLPDRAIGETEHRRYRHQPHRRPVAVLHRGQMAAQDRRRAEIVRRRHRQRLDRRNRARHLEQESERRLQDQLVKAGRPRSPQIP